MKEEVISGKWNICHVYREYQRAILSMSMEMELGPVRVLQSELHEQKEKRKAA